MKRIIADIHTHTIASGHAYGTIREMAQAASERKLEILGHSDHAPGIVGTCDPIYFLNFSAVPRRLYDVFIIHGSEVNVRNDGTLSLPERHLKAIDYAICGIHRHCYEDAGRERNTDNLISCMQHPKVKLISHPDDDHTPLDYERLVTAAKRTGTALEVNNSSLIDLPNSRLNAMDNYRTMLSLCAEQEVPVIVSSDAHDPSQVALHGQALALLEEIRFPEELILNNDAGKLLRFLGITR